MITLCGVPFSNSYNRVKLALLEKDLPFMEEHVGPSQEPDFLTLSPMGKIPYIKTGAETICESGVILEYLEQACPDKKKLLPEGPLAAARAREASMILDLYVDAPARRILPAALFDKETPAEIITAAHEEIKRGVAGFLRVARFEPYIGGGSFTLADVNAVNTLPLISVVLQKLNLEDPIKKNEKIQNYYEEVVKRKSVAKVWADRDAAIKERFGDLF